LIHDENTSAVASMLKVSPSTVSRYQERVKAGEFKGLWPYFPSLSRSYTRTRFESEFINLLSAILTSHRSSKRLREKFPIL